jgi:hypothetical protein
MASATRYHKTSGLIQSGPSNGLECSVRVGGGGLAVFEFVVGPTREMAPFESLAVSYGEIMRVQFDTADDGLTNSEVRKLDYGRPSYPKSDHPDRQFPLPVPVSFLLVVLQIPWFIVVVTAIVIARAGKPKNGYMDSFCIACVAIPSIASILFAVRRWFWPHSRRALHLYIFNILAFICAIGFLLYIFSIWYSAVWLYPNVAWDFP